MTDRDKPLTVRQVADRLGLRKTATVLHWIHTGQLPAEDAGRGGGRPTWRITEAALEAFRAARRAVPAPAPESRPRRRGRPAGGVVTYF